MKKLLSLALCFAVLLGLCACGGAAEKAEETALQVGFGRTDITPTESVQLRGYDNAKNRWSKNVLDPLYATCIALTDGNGMTVLMFHLDLCTFIGDKVPFARKAVADAVGVPIDQVMAACTHTHSAPLVNSDHPTMERYCEMLKSQMVAAAREAMADRKNAQVFTASTTLEGMNFVRHYVMSDGSVVGDGFGSAEGKTYAAHMRESDKEMQLIRFKRDGGKDVVLVNFQVHPHRTGGETKGDVSADIVGAMRMYMEPRMDCLMAYFTGGSGDLNPTSRITQENITGDYLEQGAEMAKAAIQACDSMTHRPVNKLQLLRRDQTGTEKNTVKFTTYAISMGDVAFITAPYEMFDTNGRFIKDNSPFETTFVVTCANSSNKYVPAEWAYYEDVVAYEVRAANYPKGTAEGLADGFVEMLNELYPTR